MRNLFSRLLSTIRISPKCAAKSPALPSMLQRLKDRLARHSVNR